MWTIRGAHGGDQGAVGEVALAAFGRDRADGGDLGHLEGTLSQRGQPASSAVLWGASTRTSTAYSTWSRLTLEQVVQPRIEVAESAQAAGHDDRVGRPDAGRGRTSAGSHGWRCWRRR